MGILVMSMLNAHTVSNGALMTTSCLERNGGFMLFPQRIVPHTRGASSSNSSSVSARLHFGTSQTTRISEFLRKFSSQFPLRHVRW